MKLSSAHVPLSGVSSDIIASFHFHDNQLFKKSLSPLTAEFGISSSDIPLLRDFSGKEGESILLYTASKKVPRLLLIGLGESKIFTIEKLRRASASAAKKASAMKSLTMTLYARSMFDFLDASLESIGVAVAEGSLLSQYAYDKYLSVKKKKHLSSITLLASSPSDAKILNGGIRRGIILSEATAHARDLENAPGNEIYPETLAKDALRSGRKHGFSVTVFSPAKIRQLKMGGVIAVSDGSDKGPRFITLEYGRGFKKAGTVVLVGKGVTFDSGGISIKPAANMAEMKMDMSGAAAVIGTLEAAARLKVKKHIVGLIPSVENMLSGSAVKPGDIIRHYNGMTSEVDNTDAEGRLILADALAYAATFKPSVVIDLATLTGAVVVALGHYATGMMGNDQKTMDLLKASGEDTYERVWQLPMFDEYDKLIKSDIADVKNVGGRWAGAITAAWFLRRFIGSYKWVHLDIAGTAILESDQDYAPKGGSGIGVRLLIDFLQRWK